MIDIKRHNVYAEKALFVNTYPMVEVELGDKCKLEEALGPPDKEDYMERWVFEFDTAPFSITGTKMRYYKMHAEQAELLLKILKEDYMEKPKKTDKKGKSKDKEFAKIEIDPDFADETETLNVSESARLRVRKLFSRNRKNATLG